MDIASLLEHYQIIEENLLLKQLSIVIIYAVGAKVADLFIIQGVMRLARRTSMEVDDTLIALLHAPVLWTIFSLGILHALVLGVLPAPWQTVLPSLTKTTIVFVWLIALIRIFNVLAHQSADKILSRGKIGSDFFYMSKNILRVLLVILGLFWMLSIWKLDLTPLFASAGIAGIAVALAAKDTLANFFGGISIFLDKTFKVGDYIILDSSERGEVVEVGIRSTRIKTRDDVLVTIPNSIMANSKIVNESAPEPRFRIRIPVGVAYGSDLEKVENVLLEVAAANSSVVTDPAPRVRLRAFNNSSLDFELLVWVHEPSVKGLQTHNLLTAVYHAFREQGVTIPFPQLDVHFDKPMKTDQ
ncbi:MAG: mechanosensitive ion channel [Proteobacteria bacterium]|nr:mechanosensitive ion channel [Pseudomonadota bacterium]MBU1709631.1 mechanosensitive ion channel [Pseudomonadota bacterium]